MDPIDVKSGRVQTHDPGGNLRSDRDISFFMTGYPVIQTNGQLKDCGLSQRCKVNFSIMFDAMCRPSQAPRQSLHMVCFALRCSNEPKKLQLTDGPHEPGSE